MSKNPNSHNLLTIRDPARNRTCALSSQVYSLKRRPAEHVRSLHRGTKVRMISGINGRPEVGYHFDPLWVTVCPITSKTADFIGVLRADLIPVSLASVSSRRRQLARAMTAASRSRKKMAKKVLK